MDCGEGSTLICFSSSFSSFMSGNKKLRPFPSRISSILSLFWSHSMRGWNKEKKYPSVPTKDSHLEKNIWSEQVYTYQVASSACWPCSAGTDHPATHDPSVWPAAADRAGTVENVHHSPAGGPNRWCWPGLQWWRELQTVPGRTWPAGFLPQSWDTGPEHPKKPIKNKQNG